MSDKPGGYVGQAVLETAPRRRRRSPSTASTKSTKSTKSTSRQATEVNIRDRGLGRTGPC